MLELGSRLSAGVCGSLLAEAGATVFCVEPPPGNRPAGDKWAARDLYAAGKHSLIAEGATVARDERLIRLAERADVVLLSSDIDPAHCAVLAEHSRDAAIVCDFTAFGKEGPLSGEAFDDAMVQALAGVAHTTGRSNGPPVALRVPVIEYSTGAYGAASVAAALICRDRAGVAQTINMALYDCAVNALATFLPEHFGGGTPLRLGNGHMMCTPWNAYKAKDGWVLICSASDPPWQRLCKAIGKPQLADDPHYATLAARLERRSDVDEIVQSWVGTCSVHECVDVLLAADVACGPIVRLSDIGADANVKHRDMIREVDGPSSTTIRLPGALLKAESGSGRVAASLPQPDDARSGLDELLAGWTTDTPAAGFGKTDAAKPLAGIRVIEIGQYTTAPLACRHLATLGAEVIKLEPPDGDAARRWPPHNGDESYFFTMSNAGKKSIAVDLRSEAGRAAFGDLLETADMLVENLKPGSLARLGFDLPRLRQINPMLIYCAISGFGADSAYGQRPAFDTVLQAMSGMMDANAGGGVPIKAGISICDVMGGEIGLFFLLAALRSRPRAQRGDFIDLSMQDVAVWMTAPLWMSTPNDDLAMAECSDGYVLVRRASNTALPDCSDSTRAEAMKILRRQNLTCVPVNTISEAAEAQQTQSRELIFRVDDERGLSWPLLGSPMRLARTQPRSDRGIGKPQPLDRSTIDHAKNRALQD